MSKYIKKGCWPRKPLAERFWAKVDKSGECWEWTAGKVSDGYGSIGEGGRGGKILGAHRVAWFLEYGEWPTEHVLHRCDNRGCVRVSHLFLGSHHDNMRDCREKGRKARLAGEMNGASRLSKEQVLVIRDDYAQGESIAGIARHRGASEANVWRIVHRKSWRHI